jgi:hypothetical protein
MINGHVDKIILSRPAVEAGERLGFLPGDMKEKVDPYMQPLYDALNDFLPGKQLAKLIEEKTIEIAPLAFMRGRTLVECLRRAGRGAERHLDADEDVPDASGAGQPHGHHRRPQPGGPAARPALRPDRGGAYPQDGVGGISFNYFTVQGRGASPDGRQDHRGLRRGRGRSPSHGKAFAASRPREKTVARHDGFLGK